MNKLSAIALFLFTLFLIPSLCSAQPIIKDCRAQKCYTVLFPFPHSKCECVDYHNRYYPRYVPRKHHHMPPPPRDHRSGHHPPHHKSHRR